MKKKEEAEKLRLITLHLPKGILQLIEEFKHKGLIPNRAEYIRNALLNQIRVDTKYLKSLQTLKLELEIFE